MIFGVNRFSWKSCWPKKLAQCGLQTHFDSIVRLWAREKLLFMDFRLETRKLSKKGTQTSVQRICILVQYIKVAKSERDFSFLPNLQKRLKITTTTFATSLWEESLHKRVWKVKPLIVELLVTYVKIFGLLEKDLSRARKSPELCFLRPDIIFFWNF